MRGQLFVPDTWKGSWRRNMRWRGLTSRGPVYKRPARRRDSSIPLVCFTGTMFGRNRDQMIAEAREYGWETTNSPSPYTDVLVAADTRGASAKLVKARSCNTPIITPEEWEELMIDGALPDRDPTK